MFTKTKVFILFFELAMSNVKIPSPKKENLPPNIITKPTNTRGPGYADIGLSPFPEYKLIYYKHKRL